mmetsp:Transcript_41189/g.132592  ORF Transcript_41189/g.132592 Transcript_41189/m.132592 type:complete len:464 (-) Transcript_41189:107-1498(-)
MLQLRRLFLPVSVISTALACAKNDEGCRSLNELETSELESAWGEEASMLQMDVRNAVSQVLHADNDHSRLREAAAVRARFTSLGANSSASEAIGMGGVDASRCGKTSPVILASGLTAVAILLLIPARGLAATPGASMLPANFLSASALLLIACAVGMGFYMEGWCVLETLYFVTQIVTTVGYGDFCPKTDAMRIWTAFFILFCLTILAQLMSNWTAYIESLEESTVSNVIGGMVDGELSPSALATEEKKVAKSYFVSAVLPFGICVFVGTAFYALVEDCTCSYGAIKVDGCQDDTYQMCVATGGFKQTWCDAFYMSVVTLTTVGFGDFTLRTTLGRIFGIPWMIIGVASCANWVSATATMLAVAAKEKKASKATDQFVEELDADGDGQLTKAEHHLYILLRSGLVSQDLLGQLDGLFHKLDDNDSDTVTVDQVRESWDRAILSGSIIRGKGTDKGSINRSSTT